jgi:hypothetical protein
MYLKNALQYGEVTKHGPETAQLHTLGSYGRRAFQAIQRFFGYNY